MSNRWDMDIFKHMEDISPQNALLTDLYKAQMLNQQNMLTKGLYDDFTDGGYNDRLKDVPYDNPRLASYHIQQLVSEIGEVLESDKRWKNFRNNKYDRKAKLEEIADCMIVIFNVAIFSGISAEQLVKSIIDKLIVVADRVNDE